MTDEEIQTWQDKIDKMDRYQMLRLQRFAPVGHPVFNSTLPLYDYFKKRFDALGGITPGVSKAVGWENGNV